ncbi:hypothetical protein ACFL67_04455, partial [candidate division KSB1 bacterium]
MTFLFVAFLTDYFLRLPAKFNEIFYSISAFSIIFLLLFAYHYPINQHKKESIIVPSIVSILIIVGVVLIFTSKNTNYEMLGASVAYTGLWII